MIRPPYILLATASVLVVSVAIAQGPAGKTPTPPPAAVPGKGLAPGPATAKPGLGMMPSKMPAAPAAAVPAAHPYGGPGIYLTTKVGSFKIKRGDENPDDGMLDMSFRGTVLVSGLDGVAEPSAGARLEYERKDHNKRLFFSPKQGKLHVQGKFVGIQFFGQDLNAVYHGSGVLSLYGEFDKNLNTGYYWYGDKPSDKHFWGTGGGSITPAPYRPPAQNTEIKIKNVTPKKG